MWYLVPIPTHESVIVTRRVYTKKLNEDGIVIRNKVWLVEQDLRHEDL